MKKLFAILVIVITMCTLCACGPSNVEENVIPEKVYNENSMFVCIGNEITIDGVTYTASTLCVNGDGYFYNTNEGVFYVNRVNYHVFYIKHDGSGRSGTAHAFDTGIVYEGPIIVEGVEIPKPNN